MRWVVLPRLARARGGSASRPAPGEPTVLRGLCARFGLGSAVVLPAALVLVFVRQLVEFRDPFVPWTQDAQLLLTGTAWGRTYLAGLGLALVTPVTFVVARSDGRLGWILATVATLAACAFPALTGHANTGEGLTRLATVGADVVHVWAAGAWLGGLAVVLFLDRWSRRAPDSSGSLLPTLVPAFSPLAVTSVALLVTTGVFASWIHLPGPSALLTTEYGRALAVKLLLVGVVLLLGFVNWRRLTPRLARPDGPEALTRSAWAELWIVQAVLVVTAVLVWTPPPPGG